MPLMFDFIAEKIDDRIALKLKGNFSIAQVDIALKDICIFLKGQSLKKNEYFSDSDGYLKVSVDRYNRELTDIEQTLVKLRLFPINQVTIDQDGFSLEEIQELMQNIQNQLPDNYKSRFTYSVDFKRLTIDQIEAV